ncbi:hypothetical protein PMAYCL1PPCAC_24857, partial [Pristionchus mayeri]
LKFDESVLVREEQLRGEFRSDPRDEIFLSEIENNLTTCEFLNRWKVDHIEQLDEFLSIDIFQFDFFLVLLYEFT